MATAMVIAVILGIIALLLGVVFVGEAIEKFGKSRNIGFVRVLGVLLRFCGTALLVILFIGVVANSCPGSDGLTVTPPVYTR